MKIHGEDYERRRSAELIVAALEAENDGDYASALKFARELVEITPGDPRAANTLSGLYGAVGDFERQILWAKNAITFDQSYSGAYINLANGYSEKGLFDLALANFSMASELDPGDPIPAYSIALTYEKMEKYESAVLLYKKALQISGSEFTNSNYNLACLMARRGNIGEAISYIDTHIQTFPDDVEGKDLKMQLLREDALRSIKSQRVVADQPPSGPEPSVDGTVKPNPEPEGRSE